MRILIAVNTEERIIPCAVMVIRNRTFIEIETVLSNLNRFYHVFVGLTNQILFCI